MLQIFPRGRSAMKVGISAMLQTFPLGGGGEARGKIINVADLPGEGLQCCRSSGGRSAIQHPNYFLKKRHRANDNNVTS